jgi:hypothetical protein
MKMRLRGTGIVLIILFVAGFGFFASGAERVVGFDSMSGYDHLLVWRDGVEVGMSSSSSPRNRNIDFHHFHGIYRGEQVLVRVEGPGCIYRVWSAQPMGIIKFYLDGAKRPAGKCKFKDYLEGGCADLPSFPVGRSAQYLPIPFENSAVITTIGFDIFAFYQISYQTYASAEGIKTFVPGPDAGDPEGLRRAQAFWDTNGASALEGMTLTKREFKRIIGPGEKLVGGQKSGSGIIREFSLADADDPMRNLSGIQLRIFTDPSGPPDIDCPAHALFGSYYDSRGEWEGNRWSSLAFEAGPDGFTCRLPMPYHNGIRIEIENTGDAERSLVLDYQTESRPLAPGTMHLHAEFRKQGYPTDVTRKTTYGSLMVYDPSDNYVVLERGGRGYYVGCFLYVESVGPDWWGEGDENTFVDGASWPPVIQGTGTEDEFNWSWGYTKYLTPVSGILIRTPQGIKEGETGPNVAFRFRISDYVPFRESIKVSYERQGAVSLKRYPGALINQSKTRGDDYASVAYWYELP